MLEDLRKQADEVSIPEDEIEQDSGFNLPSSTLSDGRFLGMTPAQRFVIAFMIFALTCLIGTMWLLVTQKIVPPFLF